MYFTDVIDGINYLNNERGDRVHITGSILSTTKSSKLPKTIEKCKVLREIHFRGALPVQENGAFLRAIARHPSLEKATLENFNFTKDLLPTFFRNLSKSSCKKEIGLQFTPDHLTDEMVEKLVKVISKEDCLKSLELYCDGISDKNLFKLFTALKQNRSITNLVVSNRDMKSRHLSAIASALEHSPVLANVYISCSANDPDGRLAIFEACLRGGPSLERVDIRDCAPATDAEWIRMTRRFPTEPTHQNRIYTMTNHPNFVFKTIHHAVLSSDKSKKPTGFRDQKGPTKEAKSILLKNPTDKQMKELQKAKQVEVITVKDCPNFPLSSLAGLTTLKSLSFINS